MFARQRAIAIAVAVVAFAVAGSARADDDSWFDDTPAQGAPAQSAPADSAGVNDSAPQLPHDTVPPARSGPTPKGLAGIRHSTPDADDTTGAVDPNDADPHAIERFRPVLAPYGRWVDDPSYGLVWVPSSSLVGPHFAPYVTSGHWELDTYGEWVWVSDYPFGNIVFHYGRWAWTEPLGWVWIPGSRYASAWVVWRVPDGDYAYVGWAPAPVTFVWIGGRPVYCGWYHPVGYVYVSSYYVFSHHPTRYIVRDHRMRRRLTSQTRRLAANPHGVAGPSLAQARIPPEVAPRRHRPATFTARPATRAPAPGAHRPAQLRELRSVPLRTYSGRTRIAPAQRLLRPPAQTRRPLLWQSRSPSARHSVPQPTLRPRPLYLPRPAPRSTWNRTETWHQPALPARSNARGDLLRVRRTPRSDVPVPRSRRFRHR